MITKTCPHERPSVASKIPYTRLIVVLLSVALVGSVVALGGVAAVDQHTDDNATDGNGTDGEMPDGNATDGEGMADDADENETDDDAEDEAAAADPQQTSYLRVVHASPDAPAVDVLIENDTVLSNVSFGDVSDYLPGPAGTYNVTIAAAEDPDTVVFDDEVTIEPRTVVTIAASGEISAIEPAEDGMADENESSTEDGMADENESSTDDGMADENDSATDDGMAEESSTAFAPVIFADNAWTPEDDESALRVVHLSPDAPAVDITAGNGSVVIADDVEFGNASDYVTVPAGDYTAEVRPATEDNNGTVVTTVDVSLEGETAYSAWALGYLNPDDAPANTSFQVVATEDATMTVELPSEEMVDDGENVSDDAGADGENVSDDAGADGENVSDDAGVDGENVSDDAGAHDENTSDDSDDEECNDDS